MEKNRNYSSLKEMFERIKPDDVEPDDIDDFDFGYQDRIKIGDNWTKKNLKEILKFLKYGIETAELREKEDECILHVPGLLIPTLLYEGHSEKIASMYITFVYKAVTLYTSGLHLNLRNAYTERKIRWPILILSAFYRTRKPEWDQLCYHLKKFGKEELNDEDLIARMITEGRRKNEWLSSKNCPTSESDSECRNTRTPEPEISPSVVITPPPSNHKLYLRKSDMVKYKFPLSPINSPTFNKVFQHVKKTYNDETIPVENQTEKNKKKSTQKKTRIRRRKPINIEFDSSDSEENTYPQNRANPDRKLYHRDLVLRRNDDDSK